MCVDTYKRLMSMKNRKLSFLFLQLLFFVSLTSMAQPGSVKKATDATFTLWRLGLGNPL